MNQISKMNEAVGMINHFTVDGRGKRSVCPSKVNSSGNVLVEFYCKLPMLRKDKNFSVKYQKLLVVCHLLNYEDIFVETPIYIRYVVINIDIFTSILAIELFYLTQLRSFLVCFLALTSLYPLQVYGTLLTRFK